MTPRHPRGEADEVLTDYEEFALTYGLLPLHYPAPPRLVRYGAGSGTSDKTTLWGDWRPEVPHHAWTPWPIRFPAPRGLPPYTPTDPSPARVGQPED